MYGTCCELEERWLAGCITGLHVNFQCVVYVGYIIMYTTTTARYYADIRVRGYTSRG